MTTADGWVCADGNETAARVAHRLSEVIAIYPITRRRAALVRHDRATAVRPHGQ